MQQKYADLSAIEVTILDEADHMADLGFLPGVRRIMDKTPQDGQRLLFSATLDKAIDVLVKRFLTNPVTHEADSAQSTVSTMSHHVLHVNRDQRVPILVDLTSAPGRTVVFTRTKHGAKALARQLNKSGVPTVELHGNLSQNARTRNMDAFHSGKAATLVATDIAARGIHVDDVALVDPRRPAGRAQGLPAPLGSYGACRRRGHGHHPHDRRAGARRARPDPSRGHQAHHHQGARPRSPDAGRARPRCAQHARRSRRRRRPLGWRLVHRRQRPAQARPQHRPDQRPVASGQPDRRFFDRRDLRRWFHRWRPASSLGGGGQGAPASGSTGAVAVVAVAAAGRQPEPGRSTGGRSHSAAGFSGR